MTYNINKNYAAMSDAELAVERTKAYDNLNEYGIIQKKAEAEGYGTSHNYHAIKYESQQAWVWVERVNREIARRKAVAEHTAKVNAERAKAEAIRIRNIIGQDATDKEVCKFMMREQFARLGMPLPEGFEEA